MVKEERKLAVLAAMPATRPQIAKKLKWSHDSVRLTVNVLRDEGRCHVGGWVKKGGLLRGGSPAAIYHAGAGEDVPKTAEFMVLLPAPEKKSAVQKIVNAAPHRDPMVAALFGPA